MEAKHTPGPLELKYVNDICIGIGTVGPFGKITANSILPDSDEEYKIEKKEIVANMILYASAPDLIDENSKLKQEKEELIKMLEKVYEVNRIHFFNGHAITDQILTLI